MAFSLKKRTLDQAQRYVQKGQYDKALKEYQKHLQTTPDDTNARLKLGDLHLKRGDTAAAIEAYTRVAEQFSKGGFDAKAVAIYKQILKIEEGNLKARIELGDHFQRMGLTSDALREFQRAVRICQERGLKREAFDLLKRVAALDPSNVQNRLSLADLLLREKLGEEAREEYESLLDEVERMDDPDLVQKVAERLLDAFSDHERAALALVKAMTALRHVDSAIKVLQRCIASNPDSVGVREALVQAYETHGDEQGVRSTYQEIAELFKRRGDHDKAREILQRYVPVADFGADHPDTSPSIVLSEEAEEFKLEDPAFGEPDQVDFSQLSDDAEIDLVAEETVEQATSSVADLLAEARVSLEFEDLQNAAKLARRVLGIEPDNAEALQMLERAEASAAPTAAAAPRPFEDSLPDIELVLEDEEDSDDAFASIEPPTQVNLSEHAAAPELEPPEPEFEPPEPELEPPEPELEPPEPEPPAALEEDFEIEFEDESEPSVAEPVAEASSSDEEEWASQSTFVQENLEQAERCYEEGRLDEAERAYREVLERVPNHPQALVRLGELAAQRGAEPEDLPAADDMGETHIQRLEPPAPPPEPLPKLKKRKASKPKRKAAKPKAAKPKPEVAEPEPETAQPQATAESADPGPAIDIGADLQAELEALTGAVEVESEPEDVAAQALAEEAPAEGEEPISPPLIDALDLIEDDEAERAQGDEDGEVGEPDFDLAAVLDEEGSDATAGAVAFEEVFKAFKKGIQEQIGEEEAEAHYDLAIAYKEMGLLDDAIEQLQLVRRSESHLIESLSLLATCKLELGRPQEAAGHLAEALAAADENEESVVALRYELGCALEAAGKKGEALDTFRKVAAAEAEFRDVKTRIEELSSQ